MFSYRLPDQSRDCVTTFANGDMKFDPPIYEQRYAIALNILEDDRWAHHFKKVVEFGCCDMHLLPLMRRIQTLEHIMQVDIDEETLRNNQTRGAPLTADYINRRERPLRIEIFRGSITDSVENLRGVDAVIGIEIIEHLVEDVLEKVPANVFGFIQPKLAIFSTPNREYNVLFNGLNANGFRIDDHKFEWTRAEFRKWAKEICKRYPNYAVAYLGAGSPPPTHKKIGHVTQIAVFARNDIIDRPLKEPVVENLPADLRPEVQYKEIYSVDYPHYKDDRTTLQKIRDEAVSYISQSQNNERYHNRERCLYQIPISFLYDYASSINSTKEEVLAALDDLKYQVEKEYIVLTEEYVDANFRGRFCDLYEDDDDFLDNEKYEYNEEDDKDLPPSTDFVDDEPQETWE